MRDLRRAGFALCAHEPLGECVLDDPLIYAADADRNPNDDRYPHLCHDTSGTEIIGLGHRACNLGDAGRRANLRSRGLQDAPSPRRLTL